MNSSLAAIDFATQWDKRHHVALLTPCADAAACLAVECCAPDLQSVALFRAGQEVARCSAGELLAWNRPESTSWRLPFVKPNRTLALRDRYSVVLETRECWDAPARLLLTYVYSGYAIGSKVELPLEMPHTFLPDAWQPRALPPTDPVAQDKRAELHSTRLACAVQQGLLVPLKHKLLVERIQVPSGLPPFHLLLDGRPTAASKGGVLVVDNLVAYAGTYPLPYAGAHSLAGNPEFAQRDRSLYLAGVDGRGAALRFREAVPEPTIEVTLYFWKL